MKKLLGTLLTLALFVNAISGQSLGTYPATTTAVGNSLLVTPDAASVGTAVVVYASSPEFKGVLTVNPSTGEVRVTNAYPAGVYTIKVKSYGTVPVTKSFQLTVTNAACGVAAFYAPAAPEISVGANPSGVAVGDFNEDGKQDLLTANYGGATVSVSLGDGSGAFSASGTLDFTGLQPFALVVGDFNADGHQDFAATDYTASLVYIRLGVGDGSFTSATDVAIGGSAYGIALADFNKDGFLDLAATDFANGAVSVRTGNGDGSFGTGFEVPVDLSPQFVVVGDFNKDGWLDIATANFTNNNVSINLNDGSGGFGASSTNISVGTNPYSIVSGYFNGDANLDLATANFDDGTVSILTGDGSGGFTVTSTVTVGTQPSALSTGNFNGDGNQDLAVVNLGSEDVSILLGAGDGSFSSTTAVTLPASSGPSALAIGDFNGDNRQDIAVANGSSTTVSIRLNSVNDINLQGNRSNIVDGATVPSTGNHTDFQAASARVFTVQNTGTNSLTLTGIATTGAHATQFVASGLSFPVTVAAGGSTTFTLSFVPTSLGVKTATVTLSNSDCDEGSYDFAVSATASAPTLGNYSTTAISTAGGNATAAPDAAPTGTSYFFAEASGNFKGSLLVSQSTGDVKITNAHPAGSYTVTVSAVGTSTVTKTFTLTVGNAACSQAKFYAPTTPELTVEAGAQAIALGDFDGDGIQDMAVANYTDKSISILTGDGSGGFTAKPKTSMTNDPHALAVGDVNGDGKLDIVTANLLGQNTSVFLGDGTGLLGSAANFSVGGEAHAVVLADFNHDGKLDFATANSSNHSVSVRLGNGGGSFSGSTEISVGNAPVSIAVGDFNNDAHLDIVTGNESGTVSLRTGDGSGAFTGSTNVTVGSAPQQVVTGDFNGDSQLDFAVTNKNDATVSVVTGNGDGSFNAATITSVDTDPVAIALGDFNGDGNLDFATANSGGPSVSIRLGNGSGNFSGSTDITVGTLPKDLAVGDFNGDGRMDFATANFTAATVSVRLSALAEVNLKGNSVSIADGNGTVSLVDHTDFGSVNTGSSLSRTYTIENTGNAELLLSSIVVSGTHLTLFTVGGITLPATIAAGGSTTFTLSFAPIAGGVKTATVTINNDDCNEAAYDFAVQGTSVCVNPTSGGVIAAAQSGYAPFNPAAFTSTTAATGHTGTLEYKWQSSTTSNSADFNDIASSNAATYDAGALSVTTWYKRLARVTCSGDWTGDAESNVLQVTVSTCTPPAAPAASGTTVCNGATAILSATGTGTLGWYDAAIDGNWLRGGSSFTTPALTTNTTYYVQDSTCGPSATRTAVTVTITNTKTWIGGSGNWNTGSNWCGGSVPASSDVIVISSGNPQMNVDFTVAGTLTLSGTGTLTVTAGKTLTVSGTANFGNKLVTFKSNAAGTAAFGVLTGNLNDATNVVVERYIGTNKRAWRLLSVPVTGTNLRNAWGGITANGNAPSGEAAGSGTLITGHGANYANGTLAAAAGYDWFAGLNAVTTSSIRFYDDANTWSSATNTPGMLTTPDKYGYMLFVRGDRTVTSGGGSTTTLKPTGTLKTGSQTMAISNGYEVIGNPYASSIDLDAVYNNGSNNTVIARNFWVWDATLGTSGAYRALSWNGSSSYDMTGGSGTAADYLKVQSGQAFFVEKTTAGNITIEESNKTGNASVILMGTQPVTTVGKISLSLYQATGSTLTTEMDGVLARFGSAFQTAATDDYDVAKISNFNENLSLLRGDRYLSIESRPYPVKTDTLFAPFWNLTSRAYALKIGSTGINGQLQGAKLMDAFAKTETALNLNEGGTITYPFSVTADAASSSLDRFTIIMTAAQSLPVSFARIDATPKTTGIEVGWKTATEVNVKDYSVERSGDGLTFTALNNKAALNATNGATYNYLDLQPLTGKNYYRIRSNDRGGDYRFSGIATAQWNGKAGMGVFPTAINQGQFTVQLSNQPVGTYKLALTNIAGKLLFTQSIGHGGGSSSYGVKTGSLAVSAGVYQLTITAPDGQQQSFRLLITK